MKQTAVEWLEIELKKKGFDFPYVTLKIAQAKEMEKQQIIDAYRKGKVNGIDSRIDGEPNIPAIDYYNETFKNK